MSATLFPIVALGMTFKCFGLVLLICEWDCSSPDLPELL